MSENSEPVVADEKTSSSSPPPPNLSHWRILWIMAGVLLTGVLASLIYGTTRDFTFGLIIGGALAFVNYFWLKISLGKLFDKMAAAAAAGEENAAKPRFLAARYFMRYATLAFAVGVVYLTEIASVVGVLLGIASIAPAIVVEGLIRIFTTNSSKREEF
jgi:hypothetical protein